MNIKHQTNSFGPGPKERDKRKYGNTGRDRCAE